MVRYKVWDLGIAGSSPAILALFLMEVNMRKLVLIGLILASIAALTAQVSSSVGSVGRYQVSAAGHYERQLMVAVIDTCTGRVLVFSNQTYGSDLSDLSQGIPTYAIDAGAKFDRYIFK